MANTYTLIGSVTATGSSGTMSFSSIPGTYTDLLVVLSARITRGTTYSTIVMTFNGSGSGYSGKVFAGDGGGVAATSSSYSGADIRSFTVPAAGATANTFSNQAIYIPNYAVSVNKTVSIDSVSEGNVANAYMELNGGYWANTSAITSIAFTEPNGGSNFAQYSTAYLYGISKT